MKQASWFTKKIEKGSDASYSFLGASMTILFIMLFLESGTAAFARQTIGQRCAALFIILLLLFIPVLVIWLLLMSVSIALLKHEKMLGYIRHAYIFVLSLILNLIVFSHIDTFIYTTTHRGVTAAPLLLNVAILLFLIAISFYVCVKAERRIVDFFLLNKTKLTGVMLALLTVSFLLAALKVYAVSRNTAGSETEIVIDEKKGDRPDILIFVPDALNSWRLKAYGGSKETTPHLDSIESVITYTRAYTNSGNTRGSITSLLTGKSPLTTKVIHPPDILHDKDTVQHLPNILARLGYLNIDLNDGFYSSVSMTNFRNAFHIENRRRIPFTTGLSFRNRFATVFSDELFLIRGILMRHANKILSMLSFTEPFFNYRKFMLLSEGTGLSDEIRTNLLIEKIQTSNQPIFARMHLLGTHRFRMGGLRDDIPAGNDVHQDGKLDAYDKAILSADQCLGKIIKALKETRRFENTILIYQTDHGSRSPTTLISKLRFPLPLIIHLPGQKEKVMVHEPVQYLDIAPSILRYLDQPIPPWMEGEVIFRKDMQNLRIPPRVLISVASGREKTIFGYIGGTGAQYFGINYLGMVADDRYYIYSVGSNSGDVFDIREDPYSYRVLDAPELFAEYHEMLSIRLEEKGIVIGPNPKQGMDPRETDWSPDEG